MKNTHLLLKICLLGFSMGLATSSCARDQTRNEPLLPSQILIAEVQAGAKGNNNSEFIELYNYGGELVDLQGWSLVYRLPTSDEHLVVIEWDQTALVPPYGSFLLVRKGEDFGVIPDGYFDQALNTSGGGLGLLSPEGDLIDAIGWGKAPELLHEGDPAPALSDDQALTRRTGERPGELLDSDINGADFFLNPEPQPQNVTSLNEPGREHRIHIELLSPDEVQPGSDFAYDINLTNQGQKIVDHILVQIALPDSLEDIQTPSDLDRQGTLVQWEIESLEPGQRITYRITARAPWVYGTLTLQNALVRAGETEEITLAPALRTEIAGGVIPISVARTLIGQEVIVEGIATMYTGGFFAGSSGTKLYIDDGSAGVQIYVPDGMGVVEVPIGARVRVEGQATLYRGALEIVPGTPERVEILEVESENQPSAQKMTIRQLANDLEVTPGSLVEIEGTLVRAEEFSYSYELDFVDDEGQLLSAYLDKLTDATIEDLIEGEIYRAIGIMEIRDGNNLLNPRQQSDLIRIYQPIVYLEAIAPGAVQPTDHVTVTIRIENYTDQALLDTTIWAEKPPANFPIVEVGQAGQRQNDLIRWTLPGSLEPGDSTEVSFTIRMDPATEYFELQNFGIDLPPNLEASQTQPLRVFNGGLVPIWAIQGEYESSPYRQDLVTTTGVVTGVFPELGGFWIQDPIGDSSTTTSEGLFVHLEAAEVALQTGDTIQVSATVREISGQTQLYVTSSDQVLVLSSGNPLPTAIALDPPADLEASAEYYEAMEGMLVSIDQPALVVGPTSRYGESYLLLDKHGLDRVIRGQDTGHMIVVDDGSSETHYDQSTMAFSMAVGDQLLGVSGPLAYTYGAFKIEPISPPLVTYANYTLPTTSIVAPPEFSVMTWNVENLFDILEPHPNDPPRPRKAEYEHSITKVVNTIISAGAPTIIGIQEVENLKILQDIAAHELLLAYAYEAVLIEGTDGRGIDVGYLVRTDQAEILAAEQWPAPEGLTSRPPLLIEVRIVNGVSLYVLNNHFTSLAGGIEATEPRRTAQALWNVQIMEQVIEHNPGAQFIVMGDLNSFTDSLPIQSLREAGLHHVFDIDPTKLWYSYVYQGVTQTLDHILVSEGLFGMLTETIALHTNADFPLPQPDDVSPLHKSDHDPLIAVFSP